MSRQHGEFDVVCQQMDGEQNPNQTQQMGGNASTDSNESTIAVQTVSDEPATVAKGDETI